jgi:hypothetical protein
LKAPHPEFLHGKERNVCGAAIDGDLLANHAEPNIIELVICCSQATLLQMSSKKPENKSRKPPPSLQFAVGQKWQMERGHAEIMQIGRTLIQYKFLKTGMIRGPIEMKSISHFSEAMIANKAKLIA